MTDECEVTFKFPTKAHRDDFLTWMSDGGGEYVYMEGQTGEIPEITRFDYTEAYESWGHKEGDPTIVNCLADPDDE
jgi:hypothetical protein